MGLAERIGILGGSFDPIHFGHLIVADEVRGQLGLDTVLLIPAQQSPLKAHRPGASGPDRLRMIELAIAGNPRYQVSAVELERTGHSYTVDTLRWLRARSEADLYFLMGYDQLNDLASWREPAAILELAQVVGMSRPDVIAPDLTALIERLPAAETRVQLVRVPAIEISSTDLRRRLAEGAGIDFRVPPAVQDYIQERGLYRQNKSRKP